MLTCQTSHISELKEPMLLQIGGSQDTPAFLLKNLKPGHEVAGPAILIDDISTIVVEPKCTAYLTANMDIKVDVQRPKIDKAQLLTECDPVQLAIFSHRQAIVLLQFRTSLYAVAKASSQTQLLCCDFADAPGFQRTSGRQSY